MQISKKKKKCLKMAILNKESKNFIKAKLTVSKSCVLGFLYSITFCILRYAPILFKKYLSIWVVKLPFFWVFYNPFMMLFHILRSVLDHELQLDNFLIPSSVTLRHPCLGLPSQGTSWLKSLGSLNFIFYTSLILVFSSLNNWKTRHTTKPDKSMFFVTMFIPMSSLQL